MASMIKPFSKLFTPISTISPGVYHYISPQDDARNYRMHLRIEQDGHGVLIINAATVLHLNQTAAEYAYYFVNNIRADEVGRRVSQRYHVSSEQARQDYQDTTDRILTLIEMPDLDPVTFLDFERRSPYAGRISAPYRLDCALTYRLPADIEADLAPEERVTRELTTEEWYTVMDKAWQAGIPHLVFTGGEPTLRADLPDLVSHAESNGQVTGLLTDGLRFTDRQYLNTLLMTGLDHIMMLYQAEIESFWQALDNVTAADISAAIHLTLTPGNINQAYDLLKTLSEHSVKAISLSVVDQTLGDGLNRLADLAASLHLSLVWDLPVPYSQMNPVSLEVRSTQLAEGAGRAWLYVEPDGDVLPAQGADHRLGNMLSDQWETIWKPS